MKKKSAAVIFLIIAVSGFSGPGFLYAAGPANLSAREETFDQKMDVKLQNLYDELGLTKEQRKQLDENKTSHRFETKQLILQFRQKMDLLRLELEKSELNMQIIYQTNNELKQLQNKMLDIRLQRILEIRKILTPEQFKKFQDSMNERRERHWNKQ